MPCARRSADGPDARVDEPGTSRPGAGAGARRADVYKMVRTEWAVAVSGGAGACRKVRYRLRHAWHRTAVAGGAGYLEAACLGRPGRSDAWWCGCRGDQ